MSLYKYFCQSVGPFICKKKYVQLENGPFWKPWIVKDKMTRTGLKTIFRVIAKPILQDLRNVQKGRRKSRKLQTDNVQLWLFNTARQSSKWPLHWSSDINPVDSMCNQKLQVNVF